MLFNRFYQPDIDINNMQIVSGNVFSNHSDLSDTIRWIYEEEGLAPDEEASLDEPFTVRRENEAYVVEGPSMQRLISTVNFSNADSLNWFHRTLRRIGVIDALREAGASEGDTVAIEDMEFDFVE